ncbi:RidA family protein [Spirosoma montaniterrae]|uniref:Reactive intermediate/imine deaminase n=1 Tax=Spirosoma montaniterrae TaxID=1178516 RepID=A0A1P9WSX4_9BACT|nr:RidA family protein [Spirosoma montaniterrae]AQG78433.1 reactive intermediate/imine deaminase [Spirosoma montaniterrae]
MANKTPVFHPHVKDGFKSPAYSPGVICDGWLYVSGQTPIDYPSGQVMLGTIESETRKVMSNILEILEGAGCSFDDVVKTTVHLADIADFEIYNAVYASYFTGVLPARTTVQSVLNRGIKVEIDVVAKVPEQ